MREIKEAALGNPLVVGVNTRKQSRVTEVLAWRILWMQEPGKLLSIGSHRVRHD